MKLILENIGMLERAEVTLHPLCVIAGENDNGKSTVGKIAFCIIKAINRYREDLQESKEFQISEKTDEIYFRLRDAIRHAEPEVFDILRDIRLSSRYRLGDKEPLLALNEVIQQVFKQTDVVPEAQQKILALRDEVQEILEQPENTKKSIENAFNKVFASEFDASLLLHSAKQGRIQLVENDLILINLVVKENGVKLVGEVEPVILKDATFIESPLILNQHDLLIRSKTLLEAGARRIAGLGMTYTTLHTRDLFDKLREPIIENDLFDYGMPEALKLLDEVVDGEIVYNRKKRDFIFIRNKKEISIKNTASGIKVFGLLRILLANELLTKNTMLIFDEPENHLHPKWQIKLAALLTSIAKMGVCVIVSSHSPYMIEALKRYSEKRENAINAGFFLAKNRCIDDKDRLSDIFSVLSEPFEEFRKMDAEDLRDE